MRPNSRALKWLALITLLGIPFGLEGATHCSSSYAKTGYAPRTMYAYMEQGKTQAQAGHEEAADKTWEAAYDYYRGHCYIPDYASDVVSLINAGKVSQAFQRFDGGVFPAWAEIGADKPFDDGIVAGKRGDFKTAELDFRSALGLSAKYIGQSSFPDADFFLGMALYGQGRRSDAVHQWRLALGDSEPATPMPESYGPPTTWLLALQLYATH